MSEINTPVEVVRGQMREMGFRKVSYEEVPQNARFGPDSEFWRVFNRIVRLDAHDDGTWELHDYATVKET